jgi:hypothetical protein
VADFEYPFASTGTPTSFPIGSTGITGIDEAGTLTPVVIPLGPSVAVLMTATATNAELAAMMLGWLHPRGYAREGAGGVKVITNDGAINPAETNVAAAD